MTAFVSLFRGINVGGHQKIRMDELKDLHESLGLKDVVTYIQSGNVVFTSDDADLAQLSGRIEDGFAKKFGFRVKVMVRTSAELRQGSKPGDTLEQSGSESRIAQSSQPMVSGRGRIRPL